MTYRYFGNCFRIGHCNNIIPRFRSWKVTGSSPASSKQSPQCNPIHFNSGRDVWSRLYAITWTSNQRNIYFNLGANLVTKHDVNAVGITIHKTINRNVRKVVNKVTQQLSSSKIRKPFPSYQNAWILRATMRILRYLHPKYLETDKK